MLRVKLKRNKKSERKRTPRGYTAMMKWGPKTFNIGSLFALTVHKSNKVRVISESTVTLSYED